jgi:hypothetical protein
VGAEAEVLAGGVAGVGHEEGVHAGLPQVGPREPEEVHGAVDGRVEQQVLACRFVVDALQRTSGMPSMLACSVVGHGRATLWQGDASIHTIQYDTRCPTRKAHSAASAHVGCLCRWCGFHSCCVHITATHAERIVSCCSDMHGSICWSCSNTPQRAITGRASALALPGSSLLTRLHTNDHLRELMVHWHMG